MSTRVINFLITFLILTSFTLNINSQTDTIRSSNAAGSLVKGSWSAQFELGTFINNAKFESFLVSIKRHFSKHSALRLGFGYSKVSDEGTKNSASVTTSLTSPQSDRTETFSGVLNFLFYTKPGSTVNVFFGGGPIYKYHYRKNVDYWVQFGSSGAYTNYQNNTEKTWLAGVNGVFGVEWFPVASISFIAEYDLNAAFGNTNTTSTTTFFTPVDPESTRQESYGANSIEFNFNIVRLGVSAYF